MSREATGQVKADAKSRLRYQHNGDGLAYIQRYQDEAIIEVCKEVERLRAILDSCEQTAERGSA